MLNILLITVGKIIFLISKTLNLGSGSTWPGHIALSLNKNFIKEIAAKNKNLKIVLIAGTNGKTTTSKLIKFILEKDSKKVFSNEAGANLLNGIASSMLLRTNIFKVINYDYAIFEIDENTLPLILKEINPHAVILLNLFRDQLDRYGEVNTIAKKWRKSLNVIARNEAISTNLILNGDDPQIAYLGLSLCHAEQLSCHSSHIRFSQCEESRICHSELVSESNPNVFYFGLDEKLMSKKEIPHDVDSIYCPKCSNKLTYKSMSYSHLGNWYCPKCGLKHPQLNLSEAPKYPLSGTYNIYNTHAALLFAKINNINNETIKQSLKEFQPAFGRQEKIEIDGKNIQIFLAKNPTGFNQSLETIKRLNLEKGLTFKKNVLLILNDRIPDGRDVSWIWDVDFEEFIDKNMNIVISGDRAYDMGLRIKYAAGSQNSKVKIQNCNLKFKTFEILKEAVKVALEETQKSETLYILPTYSAMLEVRKILKGRKIL